MCEASGVEIKTSQPKQNSPSALPCVRLGLASGKAWHLQSTPGELRAALGCVGI